jgi:hypothetical protein
MINSKYDPNNYVKHQAIPVITDNQKSNELYGSYLLRVKWWHTDTKQLPKSNLVGTLRVYISTPMGDLKPVDYQLEISSHKNIYVQFLTIPVPEFEYKIEIIHPTGITRSMLEIWEYNDPQTYLSNMSSISNPVIVQTSTDPAVAAGIAAMVQGQAQATQIAQATLQATTQSIAIGQQNAALIGQAGQAIQATTAAVVAADETKQVTDVKSDNYPAPLKFDPASGYQVPADIKTRVITLTNNNPAANLPGQPANPFAGAQFKVIVGTVNLPSPGTKFPDITKFYQGILTAGGTMEISDPTCRDEVYVIASIDQAPIYVAKTFQV